MTPAEQIDAALSKLPYVPCKHGCHDCCGPISMTRVEWARIVARLGREPARDPASLTCPLLGPNGCTVYDIRPAVCRLYGTAQGTLRCPHVLPIQQLSESEADDIFAQVAEIGGPYVRRLSYLWNQRKEEKKAL